MRSRRARIWSQAARSRAVFGLLLDRDARAITVALALLLVALAMPGVKLMRDTWDAIIVFDITQSMNVEDYELGGKSASRLAYAREAARQALRDLPCGSRVGWAAFAEYRTLLLVAPIEVCANYSDLIASLNNIDGRMRWGNASEIAKGAFWAIRVAKEVGGNPNVFFLSDGQEAPPMDASGMALFDDIKPGEVLGALIGVGGDAPVPIPRSDEDERFIGYWRADSVVNGDQGREHLSSVREPHLRALARQLGIEFSRLSDLHALGRAMREPRLARTRPVRVDLSWLPASAALMLLAWRFRPESLRWRRWKPRGPRAAEAAEK